MPGNETAVEVYMAANDQWLVAPDGTPYALGITSVVQAMDLQGVRDRVGTWGKVKLLAGEVSALMRQTRESRRNGGKEGGRRVHG